MATIEKRGTNSWRIAENYKGKRYRITIEAKKKPEKKEAIRIIQEVIRESQKQEELKNRITFEDATERYIQSKENSLSPSTIRSYKAYLRNLPDHFKELDIEKATQEDFQNLVKEYQADRSVKYAKNVIGLLKGVLSMFRPNFTFKVTYATEPPKTPYIPSAEEIKEIIEKAKGTEFEIPLLLASCCGLRRGEILALSVDDLDENNILHINKALAQETGGGFVLKNTPKTKGSIRDILVPDKLADQIRQKGYIYKGHPNSIIRWLEKAQQDLNIQKFTFHKLRHYYCTTLHNAGIPDATIMLMGGWSDPATMQKIYRHGKNDLETMKNVSDLTAKGILD